MDDVAWWYIMLLEDLCGWSFAGHLCVEPVELTCDLL